jgi:hypothetical protein
MYMGMCKICFFAVKLSIINRFKTDLDYEIWPVVHFGIDHSCVTIVEAILDR